MTKRSGVRKDWIKTNRTYGYSEYKPVPPDLIIHEFTVDEEGQLRGFPWVTPSLEPVAELRDYDHQVQDAARAMADMNAALAAPGGRHGMNTAVPASSTPRQISTGLVKRARMCPTGI